MGRLDGHVAIVTGAAQGIGAHYAKALAAEGAKVCVSDILDPAKVVAEIGAASGEAIGTVSDVSKPADCDAMVAETVKTFGKVDILIPNAAVFAVLERRSFMEIGLDEWDKVMDVNVTGVYNTFLEDQEMLERQHALLRAKPEALLVDINVDRPAAQARRLVDKLLAEEAGAAQSAA